MLACHPSNFRLGLRSLVHFELPTSTPDLGFWPSETISAQNDRRVYETVVLGPNEPLLQGKP